MTIAAGQDLEIARAVARRNLNWTTLGGILVVFILLAAGFAGDADPEASTPPPALFGSHVFYGLAFFGVGPAATLLLMFWLGRLYVSRLKTPRVGHGMLALIATLAVVAGYFVTTSTWMVGALKDLAETPGAALTEFFAQAGAFGIMGIVVTGWVTIPLAVLISLGVASATNREIAGRIAARQAGETV